MRLLLSLLIPMLLCAQSYLISSIPLPKSYVLNLDPYECDEACLAELAEKGQVFSFLAHAQDRLENPELNEFRLIHVALFNLGAFRQESRLKIALLLPYRVIGRYANSTTNAVFAYMLTKNRDYEIRSFQIGDETPETVQAALKQIEKEGFYYVIAPVTKAGAEAVAAYNPDLNVYFPTINKNDLTAFSSSLYFGGIDYRAQIDALLNEAVSPLVTFYENSRLGNELQRYTHEQFMAADENSTIVAKQEDIPETPKRSYSYAIDKHTSNLEAQLKENEKIQNGSFVLNTPIVKTGMIMSQLTLYDTNTTNILSTQINYDPLLFSVTQYNDRKEMIIANSIGQNNNVLVEANLLLSNDIVYDWINYATTVGTDLFFNMITRSEREYDLPLVDNQIIYPIQLVSPSYYRFVEHAMPESEEESPEQDAPLSEENS